LYSDYNAFAFVRFNFFYVDVDVGRCSCAAVTFVHLLSRDQQFVVDVSTDVTLECEFYTDDFNLFDNPILWRKTQLAEHTQMNMMGNLLEPFASTSRFRVAFVPQPPRYVLTLFISGVFLATDSADYFSLLKNRIAILALVSFFDIFFCFSLLRFMWLLCRNCSIVK